MAGTVGLVGKVKTEKGWRFCAAVINVNGRVKPFTFLVDGQERTFPDTTYYLDYRENGKRTREAVGKDSTEAGNARDRKIQDFQLLAKGYVRKDADRTKPDFKSARVRVTAALDAWLDDVKNDKRYKLRTWKAYRAAVELFKEFCSKEHLDELVDSDIEKFIWFLRNAKGYKEKTVSNKYRAITRFLNSRELKIDAKKENRPKPPKKKGEDIEIYEPDELNTLFKACTKTERLLFEFFLQSGFRDQEVQYFCWSDIDWEKKRVSVNPKPDYDWTPKNGKSRRVPISNDLINRLKEWKEQSDCDCPLVFPSAGCKPQTQFIHILKAVATRAGLNADNFYLHKFRATAITTWVRSGTVDIVTISEKLAGHADLKTTRLYARPLDDIDNEELTAAFKVNSSKAGH